MKTVNFILRDEPERVPGNAGSRARSRGLPKVVDLAAWRAENLDEPAFVPERHRSRKPSRRGRWTAMDRAELAATLAVAAAFLALAARVLLL